jgi:hypothetical protein
LHHWQSGEYEGNGSADIGSNHHNSDAREKMRLKNAMQSETQNAKKHCETELTPKKTKASAITGIVK